MYVSIYNTITCAHVLISTSLLFSDYKELFEEASIKRRCCQMEVNTAKHE